MTKSTITIRREDTKVILTVDGRESIKECYTAVEASLMYDIYKAKIMKAEIESNNQTKI
jgi:hypothetical protein